jgi:hypothetical protein
MVALARTAIVLVSAASAFSPSVRRAPPRAVQQHLFFGSPLQWLIGGDAPTAKAVRRKAQPNRRHADSPVGEVREVEEEESFVPRLEGPAAPELLPAKVTNNVLRFPRREEDQ